MGISKSEIAASMGIPIAPSSDLPVTGAGDATSKTRALARNAKEEGIGKEIQRRAAYGRVTTESIAKFLEAYRECGIIVKAALAANLSYSSIANLRKSDPDFESEMEQAKQMWIAEKLDGPLREIGIDGIKEPIFSPKTGQLLGHKRVIHAQVTLAYARKFDPAYRDKQELDVNHTGGVLVVTAPARDVADWQSRFGSEKRRDVIDVDSAPERGTISPEPSPTNDSPEGDTP